MRFLCLFLALLCGVIAPACAQVPVFQSTSSSTLVAQGLFPFALPWDDGSPGPTDVSFLNDMPAGKNGFLHAQGEYFVDDKGNPVRLWGVNLNFNGVFPDKSQAPFIAGRLAKFGFNAVRIHHYEGNANPTGIWVAQNGKPKWPNEIDPTQQDKLDFFLSELIKRGIYIDLNLHVARKVTDADGFPDSFKMPEKDKGIAYFEPRLMERNQAFAKLMLTHVNPYLGRAYKDEPGFCAFEVDNESSLLAAWLDGSMDKFPPTYANDLRQRWNDFVAAKYTSEGTLHRAWTEYDAPVTGPELLLPAPTPTPLPVPTATSAPAALLVQTQLNQTPPQLQPPQNPPTQAPITPTAPDGAIVPVPGTDVMPPTAIQAPTLEGWQLNLAGGAQGSSARDDLGGPAVNGIVQPGLSINMQQAGTVSWGFQLSHGALPIEDGRIYTFSFAARADSARTVSVNLWEDRKPFRWLGFSQNLTLHSDWATYNVSFQPVGAVPGFVRLTLNLGNSPGLVQLSALSLRAGGLIAAPDEWSRRGNIPLISATNEPIFAVRRDFAEFLGGVEAEHVRQWRDFLKTQVGVKAPIWQTQAQFGGWGGVEREKLSDAVDVHIYWKHPEFGGTAWDGTNWRVANESMAASTLGDPLIAYSLLRVPGKPFVVTEWNSGQPNDYGAETLLMAATHAAYQGWAGVWMFDYHSAGDFNRDHFENFFSIDSNPAKMTTAPLAALLFRRADVAPAQTVNYLAMSPNTAWDEVANTPTGPTMGPYVKTWTNSGASKGVAFTGKTEVVDAAVPYASPSVASLREPSTWVSDTDQIKRDSVNKVWTVDTPLSKSWAGFVASDRLKLSDVELWFSDSAKWAAGGITSKDGLPITDSKDLMLVMVGRPENPGMAWNATRDSVGANWGNGPTQLAAPTATVKLLTSALNARIWSLDEKGQRRNQVGGTLKDGVLKFQASNVWRTVWYEIELY